MEGGGFNHVSGKYLFLKNSTNTSNSTMDLLPKIMEENEKAVVAVPSC